MNLTCNYRPEILSYVLGLFKGIFGLFNAYLVVFGLFLPKTEEKNLKIPTEKNLKNIIKIRNVDMGGREGGSADVDSI